MILYQENKIHVLFDIWIETTIKCYCKISSLSVIMCWCECVFMIASQTFNFKELALMK